MDISGKPVFKSFLMEGGVPAALIDEGDDVLEGVKLEGGAWVPFDAANIAAFGMPVSEGRFAAEVAKLSNKSE